MKYRFLTLLGLLALSAGSFLQAQDYDDIYYDASKSSKAATKVVTPAKTVAVYGEVPDNYKVAAQTNYRIERDEDEYNRRGAYDPSNVTYEIDINGDTIYFDGDTIYEDAFANTRRIERFYNPDIVILSDDDDLVQIYYDESPSINLVVGSDWGWGSYYGLASSYYPWYTGWYEPWYTGWYDPWYSPWHYGWYRPWYWHGPHLWGWTGWGWTGWGWSGWGHRPWIGGPHGWDSGHWTAGWQNPHGGRTGISGNSWRERGGRVGLASNRNGHGRIDATAGTGRNGISPRGNDGNRPAGVGTRNTTGSRGGYASGRSGGNMGSRSTSGVSSRSSSGVSRTPSSSSGGSRSYSSGGSRSYSGGSSSSGRSSSGSYSGGSHSSGSYSGGGSSRGSSGGGGGGSRGGSSGGGGHRR